MMTDTQLSIGVKAAGVSREVEGGAAGITIQSIAHIMEKRSRTRTRIP